MDIRVGTLLFMINGVQFAIAGDFTVDPRDESREPITGMDGSPGMKVTRQMPMIEGQIRDRAGLDIKDLTRMQGVTITAEKENGKAWVLRDAFFSGDATEDVAEGTIAARWHGASIEEVNA